MLVCRAPLSYAQEAAPLVETLKGDARADYDTGKLLFTDGDFAGAEVKFKGAYEKAHDPRLLWNMAACEKNQRHYARAVALVRSYVSQGRSLMTAADVQDAQRLLDTLASLIVDVTVNVNEPGAEVYVDDEPAGTTPLTKPVAVDLGKRRITVKKQGFKDATREVEVGDERVASVTLVLESLGSTTSQPTKMPAAPLLPSQQAKVPAHSTGGGLRAAGWSTLVVGLAGIGVGITLGVLGDGANDRVITDCPTGGCFKGTPQYDQSSGDRSTAANLWSGMAVAYVLGGVAVVTGVVLVVLGLHGKSTPAATALHVMQGVEF